MYGNNMSYISLVNPSNQCSPEDRAAVQMYYYLKGNFCRYDRPPMKASIQRASLVFDDLDNLRQFVIYDKVSVSILILN